MSDQPATGADTSPGTHPFLQPYLDFWSSYFEQGNETTRRMLDNVNGGADPRAWQRRWLEAVSRSTDALLRSPMFLQSMKQNMDAAIKAKLQADDLQKEFARNANIPTADDISGLFERLRGIEGLILTRLDEIQQRLNVIESRLGPDASPGGDH